jgi:hypothetical protein
MNSPPNPKFSTDENILLLELCQATIVPSGRQSEDKHDVRYLGLTLACLLFALQLVDVIEHAGIDRACMAVTARDRIGRFWLEVAEETDQDDDWDRNSQDQ